MTSFTLAVVNAALCLGATVSALRGFLAIRSRKARAHARAMLVAFVLSVLFMVSFVARYVLYGAQKIDASPAGTRAFFAFLAFHEAISVVTIPLVTATFLLGLGRRFAMHREIAPWAYWVWMIASVTGLAVFVFLYMWPGHV